MTTNNNNLKFSVLMSVYAKDKQEYLEKAIDSIQINQTVCPNEVVIVIDGPVCEGIENLLNNYAIRFNTIKIWKLKENAGLGEALKFGLQKCNYEIIARMDSDDISVEDRFEIQLKHFEDPQVEIVGGDISEFIENENNIVSYRTVPKDDKDIKEYITKRCPFNHVTVMFRKAAVLKAGGYIQLYCNEDYYLWVRMARCNCVMKNVKKILVNVRIGRDMYTRRGGFKYFQSELFIQNYMKNNKMITSIEYIINIVKRFIFECIIPGFGRGIIYKFFARDSKYAGN